MYPYEQPQLTTFLNLINESNGVLAVPITVSMIRALTPTAITPGTGQIQDTSVRLMARPGQPYFGSQTVFYRRINLSTFFRGLSPVKLPLFTGSTTAITAAQLVAALNSLYGLALVSTDLTGTTYGTGTVTVTIAATSLCYEGSFTLSWTPAKQQIALAFAAAANGDVLNGKILVPTGQTLTYGLDCTLIDTQLKGLAASQVVTTANWQTAGSAYAAILGFLQQYLPNVGFNANADGTQGGLGGSTLTRYTLPSASVPGANSAKFTGLTTITPASGTPWYAGSLYLHYN